MCGNTLAQWDPRSKLWLQMSACDSGLWAPHDSTRLLMSSCDHLFPPTTPSLPVVYVCIWTVCVSLWLFSLLNPDLIFSLSYITHQTIGAIFLGLSSLCSLWLICLRYRCLSEASAMNVAPVCASAPAHFNMMLQEDSHVWGCFCVAGEAKVNAATCEVRLQELGMISPQCTKVKRRWKPLIGIKKSPDFFRTRSVNKTVLSVSILVRSLFLFCVNTDKGSLLSRLDNTWPLPTVFQMSTFMSYILNSGIHHVGTRHTCTTRPRKKIRRRMRGKKKKSKTIFLPISQA